MTDEQDKELQERINRIEEVRLARTCDWCGKPLPDISLEAAGDSWYCSEECAIQGCDFEKIENKEK